MAQTESRSFNKFHSFMIMTIKNKEFEEGLMNLGIISMTTYYCKTKRYFKVRMCEHLGYTALTRKRVKGYNKSSINKHHLFFNHSYGFDNFFMLASNNNNSKVTLMESLLINRDHPPLNKNRHSLPLYLFHD